jgi:hypothetical protein
MVARNGIQHPLTSTAFGRELNDRGFLRKKNGAGAIDRLGLRLSVAASAGGRL